MRSRPVVRIVQSNPGEMVLRRLLGQKRSQPLRIGAKEKSQLGVLSTEYRVLSTGYAPEAEYVDETDPIAIPDCLNFWYWESTLRLSVHSLPNFGALIDPEQEDFAATGTCRDDHTFAQPELHLARREIGDNDHLPT